MSKPTAATLKSFIRKNADKAFISVKSNFDGMTDCVESCKGTWRKLEPARNAAFRSIEKQSPDLGYNGVWLVGQSRDYIKPYEKDGYKGFEVNNCCGNWIVAIHA